MGKGGGIRGGFSTFIRDRDAKTNMGTDSKVANSVVAVDVSVDLVKRMLRRSNARMACPGSLLL
jgi:hypothetical protein